ncbi:MAG: YlxR family protein [Erysipelotrichaceae bacterium]|jgi:predicted RNA-binding protein YlxR (DUF448 family)|nr:YlxR family protein [Erysipelotrichaceae bacterium]
MPKKIPMRKCVATGESLPKKELVRIVRTPEGDLQIDLTGKANGHGAYLKKSKDAVDAAKKNHALSKALQTEVPDALWQQLDKLVK